MSALPTALEAAKARYDRKHVIPPITDPLGKNWKQPSRWDIDVDDTHAMMSAADLSKLLDYTQSQPTGVYPGKMWRVLLASSAMTCPKCKAKKELWIITRWHPNRLWIECYCKHCTCHWSEKPVWWLRWFGAEFNHPRDGRCVSNHSREIVVV